MVEQNIFKEAAEMAQSQAAAMVPPLTPTKIPLNATVGNAIDDCIAFLEQYKKDPVGLHALSCAQMQLQGILALAQVAVHIQQSE